MLWKLDFYVTVLRDHVPRSEKDGVLDIGLVGFRIGESHPGADEVSLHRLPSDVALKLVDGVLAEGIDDYFEPIDLLDADWVFNISQSELDLNCGFSVWRWNVILGQEGLDLECLLVSVALLCNGQGGPSHRDGLDLALKSLDLDLLRELDEDLGLILNVDSVLRRQNELYFCRFLNYFYLCISCGLQ